MKNEPAFPAKLPNQDTCSSEAANFDFYPGVTVRDYFAAKAMQGMLSSGRKDAKASTLAQAAYMIADAMLVEGAK